MSRLIGCQCFPQSPLSGLQNSAPPLSPKIILRRCLSAAAPGHEPFRGRLGAVRRLGAGGGGSGAEGTVRGARTRGREVERSERTGPPGPVGSAERHPAVRCDQYLSARHAVGLRLLLLN